MKNINIIRKLFRSLKIRQILLLFIIPPIIIALILLSILSSYSMFRYLEKQTVFTNRSFIEQALSNYDFYYQQYLYTFSLIAENPVLYEVMTAGEYRNKSDEYLSETKLLQGIPESGISSIRQIAEERIDGACYIVELDRKSEINQTDYKIHRISEKYFSVNFDIEKLIRDPLFSYLEEMIGMKMVMGVLDKGIILSHFQKIIPVIIYPLRYSQKDQKINKFILVFKLPESLKKTYYHILPLKYGTLYLLDPNQKILEFNHPSGDDYYEYDSHLKNFMNPDNEKDDGEGMYFKDYSQLNTDPEIIKMPLIDKMIKTIIYPDNGTQILDENQYVTFNSRKYLVQLVLSHQSGTFFLYFFPIHRLIQPVLIQIFAIFAAALFLSALLIAGTIFFSRKFDLPIYNLTLLSRQIAMGNYDNKTNPDILFGEFRLLGESFNHMTSTVRNYQAHLEELIHQYNKFVPVEFLSLLSKKSILDIKLGDQEQRDMTILFSDIRNFTLLSEKMSAQENFNFLNSYLKRIGPVIRNHNGFVDKYIGDAIMALFKENPQDAVDAGVELLSELRVYNHHRAKNNYQPIDIGIGINSGAMTFGIIGENERFEGTVISDAVNLCARLESLTKVYGCKIILSIYTVFSLNTEKNYFRALDNVLVKGKEEPTMIVELLNGLCPEEFDLKMATKDRFEIGVREYLLGNVQSAEKIFKELKKISNQDKAVDVYLNRCREYKLLKKNNQLNSVES